MRRVLGSVLPTLLVVALVASGCGDEEPGSVSDESTPTASGSPSESDPPAEDPPGGEVEFELVETITETAAGGAMSEAAVPLSDDTAVQEFNAQFETDTLPTRVQNVVNKTEVPDDMVLYGAVVAIGCDSPTDVSVVAGDSGLVIIADKVPSPMIECFAPMTTVALVLVPASAVS